MQRRLALTLSGTAAVVVAAAGIAGAANLGLLASASSSGDTVGVLDASSVSELAPVATTTAVPGDPVVVYVDEYVTLPGGEVSAPVGPFPAVPGSADRTPEPVTLTDTPPAAPDQAPAVKSPPTTVRSGEVDDDHDDDHEDDHGVEVEHDDDDD